MVIVFVTVLIVILLQCLELSMNDLPSQSGLFKSVVLCVTIRIVIRTLIIHPVSHEAPLHRCFCTLSLAPDSLPAAPRILSDRSSNTLVFLQVALHG